MQTRSKQECYEAIAKATYQGARRNFDFNAYVTIHQKAHQDLIRLGEPIPENKKVWDFLQGITDPQCNSIKLNVISNQAFMNSFAQTINYMENAIDLTTRNSTSSTRQVAQVTTHGNQNSENATNRGRGRRGRGGRGHHGSGRGRGRSYNHQGNQNQGQDANSNQSLSTRGYSHEEWQNLTQSKRNRIYRERERLATARTVSALLREDATATQDDVSAITGTAVPQNINAVIQGTNAGVAANPTSNTSVLGIRSNSQVSMDGVGNAFNRRRLNAIYSGSRVPTRDFAPMNAVKKNEI
jgi:hypothetical protein